MKSAAPTRRTTASATSATTRRAAQALTRRGRAACARHPSTRSTDRAWTDEGPGRCRRGGRSRATGRRRQPSTRRSSAIAVTRGTPSGIDVRSTWTAHHASDDRAAPFRAIESTRLSTMQLTDQPPPAGAERGPHADFALARAGAREQQVGDVRARDQQHDRRRRRAASASTT